VDYNTSYPLKPICIYDLWKKVNAVSRGAILMAHVPKIRGNLFEDAIMNFLRDLDFHPPIAGRASPISGISSVRHEHDIVLRPPRVVGNDFLLVECKWRKEGRTIGKDDVMIFNQKAVDISLGGSVRGAQIRNLYRLFISSVPFDHNAFRFCLTYGILVIQPLCSRILYPSDISNYPPLQAVLHKTEIERSRLLQTVGASEIEDLEQDVERLMKLTFRPVAHPPNSQQFNGSILEKKYLDIVLRANIYIKEW